MIKGMVYRRLERLEARLLPARVPARHRIVFISAEDGKAVSSLSLGPDGGWSKPTEGGGWTEPTQRSEEDEPDVDQAATCGVMS